MIDELFFNGRWLAPKDVPASSFAPLWMYGLGLLETMRWESEVFPLWAYHSKRLQLGLETLGWQNQLGFPKSQEILKAMAKHQKKHLALALRFCVFPSASKPNALDWFLQSQEAPPWGKPQHVRIEVETKGMPKTWFPGNGGLKTTSRLGYEVLRQTNSVYETLWVHPKLGLLEGSKSNVWLYLGENHWLIPKSAGQVDGVMQQWLKFYAKKRGWIVREDRVLKSDWEAAEGLWLTNALRGVLPVDCLNGKALQSPEATEVLKACLAAH